MRIPIVRCGAAAFLALGMAGALPSAAEAQSADAPPVSLAARGESLTAFDGRCIPAGCVTPRSNTPGILGRRALPAGRLARLGATPDFHHGLLDEAVAAAGDLPRLHSFLVSRRGALIVERYFNGARAGRLANIKSASKSVISALVGIAIDRGFIADVTQPISSFFPDFLKGDREARKRQITIEDLLTMRSGLESTSNRNYGAWVLSRNWVGHALSRPLVAEPGTRMEYSTGNTHLLSAILTKVAGASTWQFAQRALAEPLGFSLAQWPRDPQGVYFGGNDMLLTPRQMIAFGELYLNRGRLNGRQVVPAPWVETSFVPRALSRFSEQLYGYGWWIRELAGHRAYYAWGYGGQYVFVVPDLDLVMVTTSSTALGDERRGHRRTVFELIERFVIPAIESGSPKPEV